MPIIPLAEANALLAGNQEKITQREDFLDIAAVRSISRAYEKHAHDLLIGIPKNTHYFSQDLIYMLQAIGTSSLMLQISSNNHFSYNNFSYDNGTYFLCAAMDVEYLTEKFKEILDNANPEQHFSFLKWVIVRKKKTENWESNQCEIHDILVQYKENNTQQQFYFDEEWHDNLNHLLNNFYLNRPPTAIPEAPVQELTKYIDMPAWELAAAFPGEPFYLLSSLGAHKILNEAKSGYYLFIRNQEALLSLQSSVQMHVQCYVKLHDNEINHAITKVIPLVFEKKAHTWTVAHVNTQQTFTSIKACMDFIRKQAGVMPLISFVAGKQPLLLLNTLSKGDNVRLWKLQYYLLRIFYRLLQSGKIPHEKIMAEPLVNFLLGFNVLPFQGYFTNELKQGTAKKAKLQLAVTILLCLFEITEKNGDVFCFQTDVDASNLIREFAERVLKMSPEDKQAHPFIQKIEPYLPTYLRDYYFCSLQNYLHVLAPVDSPLLHEGNQHAVKIRTAQQEALNTFPPLFTAIVDKMITTLANVQEINQFLEKAKIYENTLWYFYKLYPECIRNKVYNNPESEDSISKMIEEINKDWIEHIRDDKSLAELIRPLATTVQWQQLLFSFKNFIACALIKYIEEAPAEQISDDSKIKLLNVAQKQPMFTRAETKPDSGLLQGIIQPSTLMKAGQIFTEAKQDLAVKKEMKNNSKPHKV